MLNSFTLAITGSIHQKDGGKRPQNAKGNTAVVPFPLSFSESKSTPLERRKNGGFLLHCYNIVQPDAALLAVYHRLSDFVKPIFKGISFPCLFQKLQNITLSQQTVIKSYFLGFKIQTPLSRKYILTKTKVQVACEQ